MHESHDSVDSRDSARRSPAAPPLNVPTRARVGICLIALLLLALAVRLPILNNATYRFNSDEAVDALVVRHLLAGRELTLFNWDSTYYGIVEGLLTIPFLPFLGQTATAFKLGAVAGHWLLMIAVYLLGARLYGRAAGILGAATLAAFSPTLVYWSTLASGGYCLVVAVGTLLLWQLDRVQEHPTPRRIFVLGLLAGLGFYIYQLFLVYLAALALWMAPRSLPWQVLLAGSRRAATEALERLRSQLAGVAWGALGFVVGAAPVVARIVAGAAGGGKEPSYLIATLETARAHAQLLAQYAAPVLLGVRSLIGAPTFAARVCGVLFAGVMLYAWAAAAFRALPELGAAARVRPRGFGTRTLLVLLVPLCGLLFVLSPNVQDVLSNRYLLPWMSALPVLAGALLARWWRSRLPGRAAVVLVLVAPCIAAASSTWQSGEIDAFGRPLKKPEPLVALLADLEQRGIHHAYAPYWTAYKATFLAGERVVVAPLADWDRYPPYTAEVDRSPTEAYIFTVDAPNTSPNGARIGNAARERFEARLAAGGLTYDRREFGFYRVYSAVGPSRLLPPPDRRPVPRLDRPSATLRLVDAPSVLPAGASTRVAVEVTNTSDAYWSTDGIAKLAGSQRVAAAFRWMSEDEHAAIVVEGGRTPLPHDVDVSQTVRILVKVDPPPAPGRYVLRLTLLQENVAWFDQATGSQVSLRVDVR